MGKDVTEQTMAERTAFGSSGGKRSGAVRRLKKDIEGVANAILNMKMNYPKPLKKMLEEINWEGGIDKRITAFSALYTVFFLKALGGDVKAAYFCADVAGFSQRAKEHKAKVKMLERMAENPDTMVNPVEENIDIPLDAIRAEARELGVYENAD